MRQSEKGNVVLVWLKFFTSLKSKDRFSSFDLVFSLPETFTINLFLYTKRDKFISTFSEVSLEQR